MGPGSVRSVPQSTEQTLTDVGLRRRVSLEAGARVGRYHIRRKLGSGGMGTVYAAFDPDLNREIAIKLLHESPGRPQSKRATALLREAQAMAAFSHPNVVTVHDVGTHEGRVFLAMDWVRGDTLRAWMKERPLPDVLAALSQAGRGLAAVHAAGLVHRDFKPTNVMVHPDGRVVVMDFGLARRAQTGSLEAPANNSATRTYDDDVSRVGSVQGTPAYMAPEQHLGFDIDGRADQFAFCVTAYEGLHGTRPFRARTVTELLMRIADRDFAQTRNPAVPTRVHSALVRGLSEVAKDRWPSMDDLLSRLEARSGRQTWIAWGGAATLATVIGGTALMDHDDPCATSGEGVKERWSDQTRGSIRGALTRSGRAFADDTARRVDEALETYVDALVDAHTSACKTEIEPTLLDRRTACLRQRSGALHATLDVLATPADGLVNKAFQVVDGLPDPAACLDPEHLGDAAPVPIDQARRGAVERARNLISRAQAYKEAGDPKEALDVSKAALALARETDFSPVVAEALATYASAQEANGRHADAALTFENAFHLARSTHQDRVAVRAATQLVYTVGYRLRAPDATEVWVRQSRALLDAMPVDDPTRRLYEARLLNNEGTLAYGRGAHAAAVEAFKQVLDLRAALHGPEHPDVAAAHSNLGLALTQLDRFDEALAHHADARASWEQSLGPEHPMVGVSLTNEAFVYEKLERFDEAAEVYEKAIALRRASLGPRHPGVALSTNNLGFVRGSMGQHQEALGLHQEALSIWNEAYGDTHHRVASALEGISLSMKALGRFEEAYRFSSRTLKTVEGVWGTDHVHYAMALQTRAGIAAAGHRDADARRDLEQARAIANASPNDQKTLLEALDRDLAALDEP
ncbi:MAG: serine/threonine-protein kinase [Myxococcota bacterium]